MNHLRARIYLSGLFLVMLAGLIYGFGWGDFWEDGGELMDNPWGIVSLVDVYVGFFLFLGWVWIREDLLLLLAKLLWAVAILVGGNLFASPLCPVCPWAKAGELDHFFLGNKVSGGWSAQINDNRKLSNGFLDLVYFRFE